jgi:hypothetical protein
MLTRFSNVILSTIALALAAGALLASGSEAAAQARYDGRWSVLIITDKGDCDRAYRYSVSVERGQIVYGGEAGVQFTGRIDRNGRVRARISRGQAYAQGSGRFSAARGAGTWSGRSPTAQCSGRWEAERR